MDNLLECANKVNRKILSRQIAEMEVYRIPKYISMLIFNTYFYLMKFLGVCIKRCKNKANSMRKMTFESQLDKAQLNVYRNNQYMDSLIKNIRYQVRKSLFCIIFKKASADEVSAKVIKSASNIVEKRDLFGKSVYEVNDTIYKKYADRKKFEYREYLIIWLCVAIAIVVFGVFVLRFKQCSRTSIFRLAIILELVDYILVARILGIWHMARLVWIITSEMGGVGLETYDYPVSSLKDDELHSIDLRMRTLHSLIYSANVLSQEQRTLKNEIESYKKQMQKNIEVINALGNQMNDEKERIICSKKYENDDLKNIIDQDKNKFEGKKKQYENAMKLIDVLKQWLIPIFREKWNGSYKHLQVSEEALDKIICSFCMGDILNIEKRFYEIDNTSNPQDISKGKGGIYFLELLTIQGGIANIVFGDKDKNGYVCIRDVFRVQDLKEPFVTRDELEEAIKGLAKNQGGDEEYKKQISKLQEWYTSESKKWKVQSKQLEEKNKTLINAKKQLTDEIQVKQRQIDKLSDEMNKKTEECMKLKELIDKFNRKNDKKQVEKTRKELNLYKQQLGQLQNEYDKRLNEIEELYDKISILNENQEEIRKELNLKEKEILEMREKITACDSIINQKKTEISSLSDKIQNSDNQIVTLNSLLKKAETVSGANQETIRKLRTSKKKLEEDKKRLCTDIKDKNTEMDNLCIEKERAENMVESQRLEIEKLQQEIEENYSKILYNEEIYEELYTWIQTAQKYIYIISPFVKYYQFTVMKRKLKDAMRNNPELRIKILYGMKDTNSNGQLWNADSIVESREFMKELHELLGDVLQVKETNTHDKVVIVDDKKFMLGSANVMSFTGDYRRKKGLHSEIVICSKNSKQLIELKNKFFKW